MSRQDGTCIGCGLLTTKEYKDGTKLYFCQLNPGKIIGSEEPGEDVETPVICDNFYNATKGRTSNVNVSA